MEKMIEHGLLYDFYGELLTEHQRKIYEDMVYHDLSISEIAQEQGISRQGVHDLIKRCNNILEGYEEKLRLVARFQEVKAKVCYISSLAEEEAVEADRLRQEIKKVSSDILDSL